MSVGFLRRCVAAIRAGSVIALVLVAVGFAHHHARIQQPFEFPSFQPGFQRSDWPAAVGGIENCSIPLGVWVDPHARSTDAPRNPQPTQPRVRIEDLGRVIAVVHVGGSGSDGLRSSITFETTQGESRTLAVGEALVTEPHSRFGPLVRVAAKYCLVACRVDPAEPRVAHLLFDMRCDRTDLQTIRWESPRAIPLAAADLAPSIVARRGAVIGEREFRKHLRDRSPQKAPKGTPPRAAAGGDWRKEVEAIRTAPHKDPATGRVTGVLVTRVPKGSRASRMGARPDDVVLAVNGHAVTSKAQAIRVARDEIEKRGRKIIEVKLLRNGREITRSFDVSEFR